MASMSSVLVGLRNVTGIVAALGLGLGPLQAATPILQGNDQAVSIQADLEGQRIVVLTRHYSPTGAPMRLLVFNLDGAALASYPLPELDPQEDGPWTAEAHLLPQAGKVLVATIPQYIYGPEPGIAGLVDLDTGSVQRLDLQPIAVAADPARNRVFLASGERFQVVNPTSGATRLDRLFARPIDEFVLSADGKLSFILDCVSQDRYGSCVNRFVSLAPPRYRVSKRIDFGDSDNPDASGGNSLALLGFDEARGRFYVGHTGVLYLEAIFKWISVETAGTLLRDDLPHDQSQFGDGFDQLLVGFDADAPYLYVDSSAAEHWVGVYDARTLRPVRAIRGLAELSILGRDAAGRLVTARGKSVQRRDPKTLQKQRSVGLGGSVVLADIHAEEQIAYLVVNSGSGSDHRQDLVRLDLASFQLLP